MSGSARIHQLYQRPLDGEAIERASFEAIDSEARSRDYSTEQWDVVRRLIHATADFSLNGLTRFSPDAIGSACQALVEGRVLIVDSNMIRAGLSMVRLCGVAPSYQRGSIHCAVAEPEVAESARRAGLPRALFAVRKARPLLDRALVLFGNSPVGLLELNRMIIEEGVRPALVVAMPVGFVHVQESKDELMTLPVPWITVTGRRGGSPLAVAALHALCGLASRRVAMTTTGDADTPSSGVETTASKEAIILLGHGSRVPDAGDAMHLAATALRARYPHTLVEVCFMSRLGPHLPETFARCVAEGARSIIVIPYFLHGGLHIQLDIPEMLQESAASQPEIRVVLGDRLGYDNLLVDILERRIQAARELPDVRQLPLPPRECYPVPTGQDEFVPMSPEAAARWRAENGDPR